MKRGRQSRAERAAIAAMTPADLREPWQIAQAQKCPCRGTDDLCPCQNENPWPRPVIDWKSRAEARVAELQQEVERLRTALSFPLKQPWDRDAALLRIRNGNQEAIDGRSAAIWEHLAQTSAEASERFETMLESANERAEAAEARIADLEAKLGRAAELLSACVRETLGTPVGGSDGGTFVVHPISGMTYNAIRAILSDLQSDAATEGEKG